MARAAAPPEFGPVLARPPAVNADSAPIARPAPADAATAYDFGRPRAFTDRHLRAAEAAHDALAAGLGSALSDALGEAVGVQCTAVHEVLSIDFTRSRAVPTALFRLALGGAAVYVDFAPALALFLTERHLGSADPLGAETRALSDLERAVVERRWLPVVAVAFAEAWQSVPPRPAAFAASAARMPVAPPETPVVVADLEVTVGDAAAAVSLAYPAATLRDLLGATAGASSQAPVGGLPLLVRAELGRTRLPVSDLSALAPGDVIPLGRVPDEPVPVWVGPLRFDARVGVRGARLAVQALTPPAPPPDA